MLTRRQWAKVGMVVVSLLWLMWELWAANDGNTDTTPLTVVVVEGVPWWVTMPVIAVLVVWLPIHFWVRYQRRKEGR